MSVPIEFSFFQFFEWMFRSSAAAGLMVVLIVGAMAVFRSRIPIKWQYAIWFLLPLRLLLPWTPDSSLSVFQFVPMTYADPHAIADEIRPSQAVEPFVGGQMIITSVAPSGVGSYVSPAANALFWVWVAGGAAAGGILLFRSVKFAVLAGRARPINDAAMTAVFDLCKQRMGVRAAIPLLEADFVQAPALYGAWRPLLLLPVNAGASYGLQECEHIFTHELVHYKRKDIAVNWLMSLLLVLHWFNPLLWYAAYRMRADQEFSCDAAALSVLGAGEAGAYGLTLIKMLEKRKLPHGGPRTAYFLGTRTYFRKRISMIAGFRQATLKSSIAGLLALLLIGCTTLTDRSADSDVVAEFRDYKVTKTMVKQDVALGSDTEKIKRNLTFQMMYREAKEMGFEPDLAAIDKQMDEAKRSTDTETMEAHRHWMGVYGLRGDAYWQKLRDDMLLSSVINQYADRLFGDPKLLGGAEYKKRYNAFMDEIYEKYKNEVKVYYDRLEVRKDDYTE